MSEKPIIFNSEMVRAVLDGRKTQTRRVVNYKNLCKQAGGRVSKLWYNPALESWCTDTPLANLAMIKCPYGKPGGRLWVRETWMLSGASDKYLNQLIKLKADGMIVEHCGRESIGGSPLNQQWTPSIHMPRWASRINLEITDIRVEKIQDISVKDIQSEGLVFMQHGRINGHFTPCDEIRAFQVWEKLWDSINAKRGPVVSESELSFFSAEDRAEFIKAKNKGYAWAMNPYVWVVKFKVIT